MVPSIGILQLEQHLACNLFDTLLFEDYMKIDLLEVWLQSCGLWLMIHLQEGEELRCSKDLIVPSFENAWVKCH
jgi:hypothetical protein